MSSPDSRLRHLASKQAGGALLVLMLVLVLSVSSLLLSGLDKNSRYRENQIQTSQALATAKESLINFALLSDKIAASPGIGYLPCPDTNGDGVSNTPCGNIGDSVEGWLPWQTLGDKALTDGHGVCLRYAVSGNYKIAPSTPLVKSPPTTGHFVIHDENNSVRVGNTTSEYALAVVFSPATAVTSQSRGLGGGSATICGSSVTSAAKNRASNYLDQLNNVNNANGTYSGAGVPGSSPLPTSNASVFIQADSKDNFNDTLIWLNPTDFATVYSRMP